MILNLLDASKPITALLCEIVFKQQLFLVIHYEKINRIVPFGIMYVPKSVQKASLRKNNYTLLFLFVCFFYFNNQQLLNTYNSIIEQLMNLLQQCYHINIWIDFYVLWLGQALHDLPWSNHIPKTRVTLRWAFIGKHNFSVCWPCDKLVTCLRCLPHICPKVGQG